MLNNLAWYRAALVKLWLGSTLVSYRKHATSHTRVGHKQRFFVQWLLSSVRPCAARTCAHLRAPARAATSDRWLT